MESVIKWQTGVPPSSGSYLITVKGTFVTTDYWRCLEDRWVYWNGEVTAWCKLSDIEPYNVKR